MSASSLHGINPVLFSKLSYDPNKDLAPVIVLALTLVPIASGRLGAPGPVPTSTAVPYARRLPHASAG